MADPFILDGEPVEDSVLYYWALNSIGRALRFAAEARQQLAATSNGHVLATVAAYYALFHLASVEELRRIAERSGLRLP